MGRNTEYYLWVVVRDLGAWLDARMQSVDVREPIQCQNHYLHSLDDRKLVGGEPNPTYNQIRQGGPTLGLCLLEERKTHTGDYRICEDAQDAIRCPRFEPKANPSMVLDHFMGSATEAWLQSELPLTYKAWQMYNSKPWWAFWVRRKPFTEVVAGVVNSRQTSP